LRSKKLRKEVKENSIPFWAQPTTKLEFHITEVQKIKEETMEESLGLGKKSYGTETDTETQSWFQLPIPKPGFGRTLPISSFSFSNFYHYNHNSI
jgi:hypothetical protein